MSNGFDNPQDGPNPGRVQPEPNRRVVGFYRVASGFRTVVVPEADTDCQDIEIVDLCGGGQTDSQTGRDVLTLSEFACYPVGSFQNRDIYFVATPHSRSPVILTSLIEVEQTDIKITVFGWKPDGNPSGRVNYDWHCCVQLNVRSAE